MIGTVMAALAMTNGPAVIAHRGASGYLPEHTLAAYAMAYGQGADVIEPDVVLSKDGVLICSHDITLERTTNVERVFPGRAREDGRFYAIDFTWREIRGLRVDGPTNRGPVGSGHRKASLDEMIELVQALNERTGRNVGIIPEPKRGAWHLEQGQDLAASLVLSLASHGYASKTDPAVIQSFEFEELIRMRSMGCELPMAFLLSTPNDLPEGGLARVAEVADSIGPNWVAAGANDGQMIRQAKELGLGVYPWTFDDDVDRMRLFFREYGVDGLFTDFPDRGLEARG